MLKLKYMFENFELAKLALENWEHDEEGLAESLKYFRISSNAVYPFSAGGKRCFLRLAPVEEKMEQNLRGELVFLDYLQKAGYSSMKPVPAKAGSVLLTLDTEWGTYYASVFEGVSGNAIEDTDYSAEIMVAYGKTLGRLHCLSMEYEPDCRKWSYIEVLAWIKSVLLEYHAPKDMWEEAEQMESAMSLILRMECTIFS